MNTPRFIVSALLGAAVAGGSLASGAQLANPSAPPATAERAALLNQYCVGCHNARIQSGGFRIDDIDLNQIAAHAESLERIVRKLRGGVMPPPNARRPDLETYQSLVVWLENELDRNASVYLPPPGVHRLNRNEYANVIRDLLSLEIDPASFLPTDDSTRGFDNIAAGLSFSSTLLEAYLSAAGKISRLAIGSTVTPSQTVYRVPEDSSQNYHVAGLPFGTRGGLVVHHEFPADGEYELRVIPVTLGNMGNNRAFGEVRGEQLEVLLDGERVELFDWDAATEGRGEPGQPTVRFPVTAGLHTVGVTFLGTQYAPILDYNNKFLRSTIETGGLPGMTFFPHVGSMRIAGPFGAERPTRTPSRDRIFVCYPSAPAEESRCAEEILSTLARRAFREPPTAEDMATLMDFYESGAANAGFESGIELALQRILAEPKFIYRVEGLPSDVARGDTYRISDLELASRLSFFLWSSTPDDELVDLAVAGRLSDPEVLERQVHRMLQDPRSDALVENFAGQWFNLRNLETQVPVVDSYPDFDDNLRQAMRRETELFFESIIREDRNIMDLMTADYTFVNERLAKHYGIPNIYGSRFQRVTLGEGFEARHGLLGKGSTLTVSARPDRNSPVNRGKWIMQNVLGVKIPQPPPNVPPLQAEDSGTAGNAANPSLREQMEMHRRNEPCHTCHQLMDPMGYALENFDATGMWRTKDGNADINAATNWVDGTPFEGPIGLRNLLVGRYSQAFIRTATEKLMTYGLGRGLEYYDMPVVRSIMRDAAAQGNRFSALVMGVVTSEPFLMTTKVEDSEE